MKIKILFILLCLSIGSALAQFSISNGTRKMATVMTLIGKMYVDEVNDDKLSDDAITSLLEKLDPHSVYIKKEAVAEMNEPLEGNFDGIGISFNMLTDTLYVIESIVDGPSQRAGIMPGDRIIKVNDSIISGINMSTRDIMKKLRGKKGSTVNVAVLRKGSEDLINFQLTRDKIPIYSLDASYMINDSTGYIRLSRFGATTTAEFRGAVKKLKDEGLKNLILDLQSNGGGYLSAASEISEEVLGKDKLIVYVEGAHQKRTEDISTKQGLFENGKLVILVNEGSASASEILSGAIQDWDRGIIVGRRTFGKGLVQRQLPLPDGSLIRLTTARYFTPSGRSIQKPYEEGDSKSYNLDLENRYKHGEMMNADSIHFPDSLKYKTLVKERIVYGGGGIMPDFFVPLDTASYTNYSTHIMAMGVTYKIVMDEIDVNRVKLLKEYPTIKEFQQNYKVSAELMSKMVSAATSHKIDYNDEEYKRSENMLRKQIKALLARDLYNTESYFRIINDENPIFTKGKEIIEDKTLYESLLEQSNLKLN